MYDSMGKKSVIMFDEMQIKTSLEYDSKRDLVEGKMFMENNVNHIVFHCFIQNILNVPVIH